MRFQLDILNYILWLSETSTYAVNYLAKVLSFYCFETLILIYHVHTRQQQQQRTVEHES